MKRMMLLLSATAFLLLAWADAVGAEEEGWVILKKNPVLSNPAASYKTAKLLGFEIPDSPPVIVDRVITREDMARIATVIIRGLPYDEDDEKNTILKIRNLYIKSTDIVLVTGEVGFDSFTDIIGDNNVIEPGAILLYDNLGDTSLTINASNRTRYVGLTIRDGAIQIGSKGGDLVNFSGNTWMDPALLQIGEGSIALTVENSLAKIEEAIFVNHIRGLGIMGDADIANPYFIKNLSSLEIFFFGDQSIKRSINILNAYFADNGSVMGYRTGWGWGGINPCTSVKLINTFFGPGQNPVRIWDSDRKNYYVAHEVFTITEPTPTVSGVTREVQTWPLEVLFAPEDFDRDGMVGDSDIKLAAESFGDSANTILFGFRYDLDEDGVVGLPDIVRTAYAYIGLRRTASLDEIVANPKTEPLVRALANYPAIIVSAMSNPEFGHVVEYVLNATAVLDQSAGVPSKFELHQNYPNPFNANTNIRFALDKEEDVSLIVRDMLGQIVRTLVQEHLSAGVYTENWDGKDNFGVNVSSGIYLYELTAGTNRSVKKLLLLR